MQKSDSAPRIFLSEPYAADMILFIEEKGEVMASEFRSVHTNYIKIIKLANHLTEMGIFEMEEERSPRVMYTYRLTEKGKMVAKKLREIEEIIGGDKDG